MSSFDGIELEKLFDNESEYGKELTFAPVTDELFKRAEKAIGYRLPASYRDLLAYRNGGAISGDLDESWLAAIYGISPDPESWTGQATTTSQPTVPMPVPQHRLAGQSLRKRRTL